MENSHIRVANRPIMWKDIHGKGLMYVHQLFVEQKFKSFEILNRQYGLTLMRYNSLRAAITTRWVDFFCINCEIQFSPLPPHNYDMCVVSGSKGMSRRVYKYLGDDVFVLNNKFIRWNDELEHDICDDVMEFGKLFIDIYRVMNIPKLRSFQYRLLQRGLVTKSLLYKWKLVENDLCSFCQEMKETVLHIMHDCKIVYGFWEEVRSYIYNETTKWIDITRWKIIVNKVSENRLLNMICLLTKQYIYKQKCLGNPLNVHELKQTVVNIERLERYIAIKNGNLSSHEKKWKF